MKKDLNKSETIVYKCIRCGECCHYRDRFGVKKRCKHLVRLPSGNTLCRIWNNPDRLNIEIDLGMYCTTLEHNSKETGFQCPNQKSKSE